MISPLRKFLMLGLGFLALGAPFACGNNEQSDLPEIKARGTLRVLTRNNYSCFFLYRGEERGFEYELARKFAEELGLKIEVVIPPKESDLIPWLRAGKGDLVAASVPLEIRSARGVASSRPYDFTRVAVVVRKDNEVLKSVLDLSGRQIWVRKDMHLQEHVQALNRRLKGKIEIVPLPSEFDLEDVLVLLSEGRIDATVAYSHVAELEIKYHPNLKIAFEISPDLALSWLVRKNSPVLLEATNRFWEKTYRSMFYNMLMRRYYVYSLARYRKAHWQMKDKGRISPYDRLIRKYAEKNGLEWTLLAALIYEESQFDPEAESFTGALGLTQLTTNTAYALGVSNPVEPEAAVRGGAKYLRQLRDSFENVPEAERMNFALAAYLVGTEHVRAAQDLAWQKGLNPKRWIGGIRETLPLLAEKEYYQNTKSGYCRCGAVVEYVKSVLDRAEIYRTLVEIEEPDFPEKSEAQGIADQMKEKIFPPSRRKD
ncbi:MAG: transporter substrate-binding domain-containing protein [bacterium]|nr:transporter substrate-binding domain-containing protein [bacterium]